MIEKGRRALLVTLEGGNSYPLAFCCLRVVPEWVLVMRGFV